MPARRAHRPRRPGAPTLLLLLLPLLISLTGTAPAAAAADTTVNVIATHSGKCLEAEDSSVSPGARIVHTDCTGRPGMNWTVVESSAGGGTVNIVNVHSGLCLEIENTSNVTGTQARQAGCARQPGADFRLVDRTTHVWLQAAAGTPRKCLGVSAGSHISGVPVQLTDCYDQIGTRFAQRQPRSGNDPAEDPPPPTTVVERLNVAPDGAQTPRLDELPKEIRAAHSVSANGRYVAFQSHTAQLVSGDTNNKHDIFVRDRFTSITERISLSSSGVQGDDTSQGPSISGDGRYIAFQSDAANLVPGDTNRQTDVFVRDRQTRTTERVSVSTGGAQTTMSSDQPVISADGRYVAFQSTADNLVPGDTNYCQDIFVRDRQTGATERVSVGRNGAQSNDCSHSVAISADGRHVAFASSGSNLVTGDTNRQTDVFVRDRQTRTTERVSLTSGGVQSTGFSHAPAISADGRHVAFVAEAGLAPGDANTQWDVYVRDRQTGVTEQVSRGQGGAQTDGWSFEPAISSDGGLIAYHSAAANLVPSDTNAALDVFVWDRQSASTERVSKAPRGTQGDLDSYRPAISGNGQFVAFRSEASPLLPDDTNQAVDLFLRYQVSAGS
ncbi:RICIN domain-containing protein [Streptomyces jumonjinensis]|uniref:RICIN domain-containing protein n=1 Tax=Streptomyces jumonjinensis TaxID=1945 RepID=UPI00379EC194